jgi:hypothetical protein
VKPALLAHLCTAGESLLAASELARAAGDDLADTLIARTADSLRDALAALLPRLEPASGPELVS